MRFGGVDLAAKSSALVVIDEHAIVTDERDSLANQDNFLWEIVWFEEHSRVFKVEDLPPGLRFDINTKHVCRIQGVLQERGLDLERTLLNPMKWMRHHGYVSKKVTGTTAAFAKARCEELGYTPPSTAHGKLLQDYRDAYLIARYALHLYEQGAVPNQQSSPRPPRNDGEAPESDREAENRGFSTSAVPQP